MYMKKTLLALIGILILLVIGVYVFIPSKIDVSSVVKMRAPVNGVYRCITNEALQNKCMHQTDNSISKKITAADPFLNKLTISLYYNNDSIKTAMSLLDLASDSMAVQWKFTMPAGINTFERISAYNNAVKLKKEMDNMLEQLKLFASKEENIYGFQINESTTKDSLLISTKAKLTHYPETNDIYKLVNQLKNYAAKSGAQITNYPMYNITKINNDTLRLMVALPVNKKIKQTDSISIIKMVQGRFLTGEVRGGNETIKNALMQMQYYFTEHDRTPMAITFNYLVTDRQQQPDTARWITKIYAPVF